MPGSGRGGGPTSPTGETRRWRFRSCVGGDSALSSPRRSVGLSRPTTPCRAGIRPSRRGPRRRGSGSGIGRWRRRANSCTLSIAAASTPMWRVGRVRLMPGPTRRGCRSATSSRSRGPIRWSPSGISSGRMPMAYGRWGRGIMGRGGMPTAPMQARRSIPQGRSCSARWRGWGSSSTRRTCAMRRSGRRSRSIPARCGQATTTAGRWSITTGSFPIG